MLFVRYQKSAKNIPSLCNSLDPSSRHAVPSGWRDLPVQPLQTTSFPDPAQCLLSAVPWPWVVFPQHPVPLAFTRLRFHYPFTCLPCQTWVGTVSCPEFIIYLLCWAQWLGCCGCSINVCQMSDSMVSSMRIDGVLSARSSIVHDWNRTRRLWTVPLAV